MIKRRLAVALGVALFWECSPVFAEEYYPVRSRLETSSLDGTWQFKFEGFYGNRARVDALVARSAESDLTLKTETGNVFLEKLGGRIALTDNLVVGSYGTKFNAPHGIAANKVGKRSGRIILKFDAGEFNERIFGPRRFANFEKPYLESYGK